MVTIQDLDRLKGAAAAVLDGAPVRFAYLYGSVARGDTHPGSDVDIAVMFERLVPAAERLRHELALGLVFDARLGGERADVRDLAAMPLILRGRVVTEGALIFSRDEEGRVAFEVAARNEYFDFLPAYRVQPQWRAVGRQSIDVRVMVYRGADVNRVVAELQALGAKINSRRAA
jgi:predicted nucleotidyltransferase